MSLETKRAAPIKTLSGGMKRRLTFVRALLADPELLILDEPTTGLDPSVRHLLWDKVTGLRDSGKTVLVSTHYMHEAEVLCDRIVILNKGSVVGVGAPRELIEREAPGFVGIFPAGWSDAAPAPGTVMGSLSPGAPMLRPCTALRRSPRASARIRLVALQLRPANLEDVYLKLTGRELEDHE
jgi:lipooligosaccharide transport system ATP-binding protein